MVKFVKLPPEESTDESDQGIVSEEDLSPEGAAAAIEVDQPIQDAPSASTSRSSTMADEASSLPGICSPPPPGCFNLTGPRTPNTPQRMFPLSLQFLSDFTYTEQRQMIGERIYPPIERMYPDCPGKLTGMLLEFDTEALLELVHNPHLLEEKAKEAYDVYQDHLAKQKQDKDMDDK